VSILHLFTFSWYSFFFFFSLNESSDVRQKFKNFTKEFREHERLGSPANGYQDARNFATQCLSGAGPMILPKHAHWRIYMVLADLSKRENSLGK